MSVVSVMGCDVQFEELVASGTSGLSSHNQLGVNGLELHAVEQGILAANPLAANSFAMDASVQGALVFNTASGLHLTEQGRDVLRYTATCALSQDQTLVVAHAGHVYDFQGSLGLAPSWASQPLSSSDRRAMSACLLAHVNAKGVSVPISLRMIGVLDASPSEIKDYAVHEGAFFGDVYSASPVMYACQGDDPEIALRQSPDRADRVCTDPTAECAIVSVGRCADVCETRTDKFGWTDCTADGVLYSETISVYLRVDDPADTVACGASGDCDLGTCNGSDCTGHFDCAGASSCSAKATGHATASFDCVAAGTCRATCQAGSQCEIDCNAADTCEAQCKGGASCLLDCRDAGTCGFTKCKGVEKSCGGGVTVCNRECP